MLAKLALRNVRRSARDYLVYFVTMTVVVALMSAFNSLLFSRACLKNAFCQMCATICGRFVPNEGRIAGYVT